MLIKVTNRCSMGCSHCMEDSSPTGLHMSRYDFEATLDCSNRLEELAIAELGIKFLMLSGGECTDHPELDVLIGLAMKQGWIVSLLTNGLWLADEKKRASLLRPEWKSPYYTLQVTNDPRFYPRKPPVIDDERIVYVDSLTAMVPLGRFTGKTHPEVPMRTTPSSYQLRLLTIQSGDIRRAIAIMRYKFMQMMSGGCCPSISANGQVHAGETNKCYAIGTIESSVEEMTDAVRSMRCNRCGLVNGLPQSHKRAIGESRLFIPGEM